MSRPEMFQGMQQRWREVRECFKPVAGRSDELDPDIDRRGAKYRRWIRVMLGAARETLRIVYTASLDDADELTVVSVIIEDNDQGYVW
jgi:hypothetical protein